MAHQIESMFSVGETPWHGLGRILENAPTVGEAIREAGLDWPVKTAPLFTAEGKPVPARATIRETDGKVLGVVGQRYEVLQNKDAFAWFDPLVQSGLVTLETAGSLADGQRIWVLARIAGGDITIAGDDVIRKFVMLSNCHDGTQATRAGLTPVRVVCANTEAMALRNKNSQFIRVRHTASILKNLESIREIINFANQSFETTADQYRTLAQKQINQADLRKYVKVVLGQETTEDKDLSSRTLNQIQTIEGLFEYGRGNDLPGVKGTAWAAYNAVSEYLSHVAGASGDKRYQSLWFGQGAGRNELALVEALKMVA